MGCDRSLDWLISVDDHVLEPPHVWVDRVPAKDRDRAPHMEQDETGLDYWVYEGKRYPSSGLNVALKTTAEFTPEPVGYERCGRDATIRKARLEDMDRAGILASLCFPSLTRFCGQLFYEAKDRDFGLVCLRAYNDWMIDEWCGSVPGRYIPLVLIPLWDPPLAARELERCAARGATAFAFSENPAPLGLPTIHDQSRYWDPVMAAANELQMVVCMHVGSSCTGTEDRPRHARDRKSGLGSDAHLGNDAVVDLQRDVPAVPQTQDCTLRRGDRVDPVLSGASGAGTRQAAALGQTGYTVHGS